MTPAFFLLMHTGEREAILTKNLKYSDLNLAANMQKLKHIFYIYAVSVRTLQ